MKNNKTEIRQPKQERSIEKKNRIISASYELFSEVGYYGTNTAEIAKRAGVSTGIVYGYFKDKKDILVQALDSYIANAFQPIYTLLEELSAPVDLENLIITILEAVISSHSKNAKMHETLNSMTHTDNEVQKKFIEQEDKLTLTIASKLAELGVTIDNATEKIHFAINIVQSFSHEFIFDKHDYIDYNLMKSLVISSLINLLS